MLRWIGRKLARAFTPIILHNFQTMGALCKAFYAEYGDDALPIIAEVMGEAGLEGARIAEERLKGEGMAAVAELFKMYEMFDMHIEVIELTEKQMHYRQPPPCPFGLEGTSKELCKAVETRGDKMVSAILGEDVEVEVVKCVAAGDEYCEVIYRRREMG